MASCADSTINDESRDAELERKRLQIRAQRKHIAERQRLQLETQMQTGTWRSRSLKRYLHDIQQREVAARARNAAILEDLYKHEAQTQSLQTNMIRSNAKSSLEQQRESARSAIESQFATWRLEQVKQNCAALQEESRRLRDHQTRSDQIRSACRRESMLHMEVFNLRQSVKGASIQNVQSGPFESDTNTAQGAASSVLQASPIGGVISSEPCTDHRKEAIAVVHGIGEAVNSNHSDVSEEKEGNSRPESLAATPTNIQDLRTLSSPSCSTESPTSLTNTRISRSISRSPARDAVARAIKVLNASDKSDSSDGSLTSSRRYSRGSSNHSASSTQSVDPTASDAAVRDQSTTHAHTATKTATRAEDEERQMESTHNRPPHHGSTSMILVDTSPQTASSASRRSSDVQDPLSPSPPPHQMSSPAPTELGSISARSPSVQGDIADAGDSSDTSIADSFAASVSDPPTHDGSGNGADEWDGAPKNANTGSSAQYDATASWARDQSSLRRTARDGAPVQGLGSASGQYVPNFASMRGNRLPFKSSPSSHASLLGL
eukprot:m.298715 g.298715  ORF g.298715 m.298715 type:complete len:550 (-) comp20097_c0_seq8:63-1712(-)